MEMKRPAVDFRGIAFLAALCVLWWAVTGPLRLFSEFVLPSPQAVWRSILRLGSPHGAETGLQGYNYNLWQHIGFSVARLIGAFFLSAAIAIPLGALMGRFRGIHDFFDSIVQGLRPIPPIAWTPLAILWFGIGLKPIIFIIVLGALWPMLVSTISGMKQVRPILIRAGQSLGATKLQLLGRVVIPSAMPFIFTGMSAGLTIGWWMIVPGEMIASNNGLGFLIMRAREFGRMDDVVTGIIAIALVGYGLSLAVGRIGRLRLFRGG